MPNNPALSREEDTMAELRDVLINRVRIQQRAAR
jgi:hypothetical protein